MSTSPSVARIAASESAFAGERPAHAADVDVLELDPPREPRGDLLREPVRRRRDAAGDRLADRHHVRLEPVHLRVPARAAADRVRLVDREQRAVPSRQLAQRVVEARLRMDDPDVRQRRLGQHERDVTVSELALERVDVVELDDARRHRRIDGWPEVAAARPDDTVRAEGGERLVDGAVVAPVEDQDG